jgi:hypothetical protein
MYASRAASYQAQVAQRNKELNREQTADAIAQGQDEQRRLGREVASRVGSQTARMGANNIDTTYGSAANVIDDTRLIGREDSETLWENTRRRIRGLQIDSMSLESERQAHLAESRQAKVATGFGVASTVLGGATQYARFRARRG